MNYRKTFMITETGDLFVSPTYRSAEITSETEKIAQDLWVILRTIKGSYKLNPDFGVDYINIIESGYIVSNIKTTISVELLKHPAVDSITSFAIKPPDENRRIEIDIILKLKNGEEITLAGSV